ncbi:MAG: FKBP-type peptidyl-prolyl cis-trans isomerase [Nitrospirae bacterium]|nr:FKBP-type peptidyl-prolyl cis-trans isomerase [Nitrospirota bacterium]
MKRIFSTAVCLVFLTGAAVAEDQSPLKTQKEKISYIIGTDLGNNFKKQGIDIDANALAIGLKDVLSGSKLLLSEKESTDIMSVFKQEFMAKQAETAKIQGEKNKKDGEAFLSENKKKEGVVTLPSGLQYKVVTWVEALQLMKEGAKWQLFVPSSLAYGDRGTPGGPIGPNAALIFEVELVSIKEAVSK